MRAINAGSARLRRRWRERRGTWWWAIVVIVVPVAGIAAAAVTALLTFVTPGSPQNQIELIKTGLTVGAGTGGVVALVLNGRRQWSTEHDATERRLTDLYLKAIEQLGSDHAAVRNGGLRALERVAQDNPEQRQTVVDVICNYLQAPYNSGSAPDRARRLGVRRPLLPTDARKRTTPTVRTSPPPERPFGEAVAAHQQEREVRLTAQRILARHLRKPVDLRHPPATYWNDIDLNLTGATLIDFDLRDTKLASATFNGASFAQDANFDGASFSGRVSFNEASFAGASARKSGRSPTPCPPAAASPARPTDEATDSGHTLRPKIHGLRLSSRTRGPHDE
ncbi:pentapeptide repeat-containing protein [Amycolatopsis sp. CA-161197]|uniref:pentapeptide repeat-containing protein n=1 Tax=Amycolatopsis sp. CA-161197 TaxID=3239922 RepID=UPI003D8D31E3